MDAISFHIYNRFEHLCFQCVKQEGMMLLDLSPSLNLEHVCFFNLVFWLTRGEREGSPSGTGD